MAYVCPVCSKHFEDRHIVHITGSPGNQNAIFTAIDPLEGLTAYAAIWVEKEVVCFHPTTGHVHIRFPADGGERLIQMVKYDPDALAAAHEYHDINRQPCEHEGCGNVGLPCYLSWLDKDPDGWLCEDHARDGGFCPGCGLFWAGFESFDFSPTGLCENCAEQLREEVGEFDTDLDGLDYYYWEEDL